METATTPVSIKKYPSGILIEEDKGTWILSPSGNIHLTDKYDERVPTPGPLEISRSRTFLLSFTEEGKMFVSPAGEVDLTKVVPKGGESLVIKPSNKEKVVVHKDGTLQKVVEHAVNPHTTRVLKKTNSVLLKKIGGKLEFENPPHKPFVKPTSMKKEVVISPLEDGQIIFSPAGVVTVPPPEEVNARHTPGLLKSGSHFFLSLDEEGNISITSAELKDEQTIKLEAIDSWVQLF